MLRSETRLARRSLIAAAGALAFAFPGLARAQMAVIDPANLAQSVMQVAHAIEQISNQVEQIRQQAQMLAQSPLSMAPELAGAIDEARSLFQSAEGLAFDAGRIGEDIRSLYPQTYAEFSLDEVLARADGWLAQSRRGLEQAMRAEAEAAAAVGRTQHRIDAALNASGSAEGQTSAVQAGNQMLGVIAVELAELQTLIAAQGRALETERMERLAREERAGEILRRAFPSSRARAARPARSAF